MKTTPRILSTGAALLLAALSAHASADFLYVANNVGNSIEVFTPGGVGSVFASSGVSAPAGVAFDVAGNLYVANIGSNTITKFTPGGVASVFASSGVSSPRDLAFDTAGNLYVANLGNDTIGMFTPGGVPSVFASSGLNDPYGLAFDSAGNLFVANNGDNTIVKFTPGGVGSLFTTVVGGGGLVAVAIDSTDNVYAANNGFGTIEKFTPGGVGSPFASSGLAGPLDLAFPQRDPLLLLLVFGRALFPHGHADLAQREVDLRGFERAALAAVGVEEGDRLVREEDAVPPSVVEHREAREGAGGPIWREPGDTDRGAGGFGSTGKL